MRARLATWPRSFTVVKGVSDSQFELCPNSATVRLVACGAPDKPLDSTSDPCEPIEIERIWGVGRTVIVAVAEGGSICCHDCLVPVLPERPMVRAPHSGKLTWQAQTAKWNRGLTLQCARTDVEQWSGGEIGNDGEEVATPRKQQASKREPL